MGTDGDLLLPSPFTCGNIHFQALVEKTFRSLERIADFCKSEVEVDVSFFPSHAKPLQIEKPRLVDCMLRVQKFTAAVIIAPGIGALKNYLRLSQSAPHQHYTQQNQEPFQCGSPLHPYAAVLRDRPSPPGL